ncbi:MAG TPA: hypothetical protein ENH62_15735 [Marinobacter sp.]|uniref:Uncharacterized protein n=1 Tax=marine sediment metagenome TaxID=412755 RepID=A0A0F9THB2_9ZZZZ|nr:hypothetical protein [Marinobacter sp.]
MTYDDKIDAMHMAERNWSHHLVMLYLPNVEWRERLKVEDKRNIERRQDWRFRQLTNDLERDLGRTRQ